MILRPTAGAIATMERRPGKHACCLALTTVSRLQTENFIIAGSNFRRLDEQFTRYANYCCLRRRNLSLRMSAQDGDVPSWFCFCRQDPSRQTTLEQRTTESYQSTSPLNISGEHCQALQPSHE